SSPTRNVLFRTVPAFCAPLIGSNSDSRSATLPNGASAACRAVTYASSGATGHGRRLEFEHGETFRLARTRAGTGKQASNPNRHVAEQGAERRAVMTLAGQHASASLARATT